MGQVIHAINQRVHGIIWGPLMLLLLLGVGIYFTVVTGFFQVRSFRQVLAVVFGHSQKKNVSTTGKRINRENVAKNGHDVKIEKVTQSITSFQAATTSLAGALGTGNIVGVATTIVVGGPGAIFWMWVSAFFGMMTKYAEIVLAVHYKTHNRRGEAVGGPMYYIEHGLGMKWLGVLFAILGAFASFGIGNMTQVNAIAHSLEPFSGVSSLLVGAVVAMLVSFVILGGIKRIASISAVVIPFFAGLYIVGAVIVLLVNVREIPSAFELIFADAFDVRAVGGGVLGYFVTRAMRFGIARGVFSNEAGMGSACFAHAAANNNDPVKEGMWGIFEVFFDTIVMCTLTALVILTAGVLDTGADGALLTVKAFSSVFPAGISNILLSASIAFFAFATLISWSYYGEKCVEYICAHPAAVIGYKMLFIGCIVLGATMELSLVWEISDSLNGAMALPNLLALLGLSPVVFRLTKEHLRKRKQTDEMEGYFKQTE